MKRIFITFLLIITHISGLTAQGEDSEITYADNTFNALRLLNGHSVETLDRGILGFYIGHRFGKISSGYQNFFGLDEFASWRLGLDYGLTDDITLGLGRNSLEKLHDVYVKYKFLKQSRGEVNLPITATVLGRLGIDGEEFTDTDNQIFSFEHRLSYALTFAFARKINKKFSIQLSHVFVHENLVNSESPNQNHDNNSIALGAGFKWNFAGSASLMTEYFHALNYDNTINDTYYGNFAIAVDITTFSHNFSLVLTNTIQMVENQFVPTNSGNFFDDEIHVGFNISRKFIL
ncbi:MAG TPA: DUF5777 family beta-barrel protein [Cyclobacteriaceae bacterium]